jgi:hypothetical protein
LDTTRVGIFGQLQQIPHLSKRFAMKRFLGMTEDEIKENEKLWREENGTKIKAVDTSQDLRSIGITPGGMAGDLASQEEEAPPDMAAAAETGAETEPPATEPPPAV